MRDRVRSEEGCRQVIRVTGLSAVGAEDEGIESSVLAPGVEARDVDPHIVDPGEGYINESSA